MRSGFRTFFQAKSKIWAKKKDETAIHWNCRLRNHVKILLCIQKLGQKYFQDLPICWQILEILADLVSQDNFFFMFLILFRYTQFVQSQALKDSQCIVFAHHQPSASDLTKSQLRKYAGPSRFYNNSQQSHAISTKQFVYVISVLHNLMDTC